MLADRTAPFHRCALTLALVVGAASLLAGCGGDDDQPTAARATQVASTPASSPTPAPEASPPSSPNDAGAFSGATTGPVTRAATNEDPALLTAVRAAAQDGFDRVVFEFRNAVPGYTVAYVDRPITADGSGEEVGVQGELVAEIRMQNASGTDLSKPEAPQTYTGLSRFTPGTSEVAEVVRTGDFEGTLTWVVGLERKVPFRVTTLDAPPRLVVDFRND